MRRLLAFISVPIVAAVGLVTAPGASADTVAGGQLTIGTAVTAAVSVADREIAYTFSGTDGTHLTLDATAANWGTGDAQLGVYQPGGEAALFCPLSTGPAACDLTLDATGTWTVKVQPLENARGSVTFKLVADQDKGTLMPGVAGTVAIATKGQRAVYSFTAIKGARSEIDVSASNWGGGGADLQIVEPSGEVGVICPLEVGTPCRFTPPVAGTWKAVVVPNPGSLGTVTLTLGADLNKGTLTQGTAVTTAISTRATTVAYSFAATAGVRHLFSVTSTDWGTGSADLNIYQPDGIHAVNCPIEKTALVCDFKPPVGGTWKVMIEPVDNAVGSATMTLVTDQNKGVLAGGVPSTTTISVPGQRAAYTFPAAAGEKKAINVTAANWGTDGSADLNIVLPNGVVGVVCPISTGSSVCTFNPTVTGTWRAEIIPNDNRVGSATLTLVADQNKGVLTPGVAATTAITAAGTTASYTFTGTKDVFSVLDVSASSWGGGSALLKIYLPNGDLGLTCELKAVARLCDFIPRVTGTWKVVIDPVNDAVGSTTMTLGSYQSGTLTPGTPVTARFTSRGLQNSYSFAATAKVHTTIDVTATNWGGGGAELRILQPNNLAAVVCKLAATPTFCDFTPPVTGTWKAVVVPTGNSLGSVTMTLATDQNKGTLAANTASTATINVKGQRAFWTFAGTAGTQRTISVTGANWGTGGVANLNLYQPNGTRVLICPITAATATCKFNVTAGGTWKAEVAPLGNAVGTATLKLS